MKDRRPDADIDVVANRPDEIRLMTTFKPSVRVICGKDTEAAPVIM